MMTARSTQQAAPWWQHAVVYHIYPRSFRDSTGDGVGDLAGIIEKMDYLHTTLGVDALWLSPFYPSPMVDFGYDVANYIDVDPLFGDLATFDALLDAAHDRNIKIIIDWVPNHTSDQHAWFQAARSSRTDPNRDWYLWADARPDHTPPNNWLSVFGGSAWTWDPTTEQYYLHTFLDRQPDLNWRNPQVQAEMFDTLRFWLDRGVDGFRIDAAFHLVKDPALRNNPPNPHARGNRHKSFGAYDAQLHLYDEDQPDVHDVYRALRQLLDGYGKRTGRPRLAMGEVHIFDWVRWVAYYGRALDELHMPFNFSLLHAPWTAQGVRTEVDALEAVLPPGAWPNYVLGNHDEPRIASRVGPAQARVAMLLLLTLRGTPTLYYGDELGMRDGHIPPDRVQDPWEKNVPGLNLCRDPQRTPMQWDDSPNAGFCPPDVMPWLPVADAYSAVNVAVDGERLDSTLALTRLVLAYRRGSMPLKAGLYRPLDGIARNCFGYLREYGHKRVLILLNFSGQEQALALPELGTGAIVVSTHLDREGSVDLADFRLHGDEGCLIELHAPWARGL